MDSFRWILLGVGILLLVGVYLLYILEKRFPHWFGREVEGESENDDAITDEEVIYLNLQSRDGEIEGADLIRAMQKYDLTHGDMGIFHRLTEGSRQPLFSVANMVEPGNFDIETLSTMTTPGLTLFLRLPRTFDALHALDEMWATTRGLASELNADILDRNRQPFSSQKQQKMRDEVLEYMRQIALQQKVSEYR
ncbi:MAG: cell division protein ZipA C-terminal FtsZ-binding domain-containing protein [Gammaproteobacteria bacterium]|nr:cell division protein ZipA C-terminal FtsZ-binding domain-containing protein [Gammaproteobacteria bacterium]